jgi:hypothetical protein
LKQEPKIAGILDSLVWARRHTKTLDEQDPHNPYKPFPADREYHDWLHQLWQEEPILFIEKSRTMMTSWWMAVEATHYVMVNQPASCIFWAQEEKPAVKLIDYAKTLYSQQDDFFKAEYPLTVPVDRQAYNRLDFKDGGWLLALPGKDPSKIRSEHPSLVCFDEAAHIERFREAFGVALLTKVPRMLAVSTAYPGEFNDMIRDAVEEPCSAESGERGRHVQEEVQRSRDDRGAEADGGRTHGSRRGAGTGRIQAYDLRLEGQVRRDERGRGTAVAATGG